MIKKPYNSNDLVNDLMKLCKDKRFKKPKCLPSFTNKEALLIRDLIFHKPKDIIYFYLANHIVGKTKIGKMGLFNSRSYRKYLFILNYFKCKGNATKAAILTGYSYKSAKQQAYRILKQIQGYNNLN
jgi:hypothetical protein